MSNIKVLLTISCIMNLFVSVWNSSPQWSSIGDLESGQVELLGIQGYSGHSSLQFTTAFPQQPDFTYGISQYSTTEILSQYGFIISIETLNKTSVVFNKNTLKRTLIQTIKIRFLAVSSSFQDKIRVMNGIAVSFSATLQQVISYQNITQSKLQNTYSFNDNLEFNTIVLFLESFKFFGSLGDAYFSTDYQILNVTHFNIKIDHKASISFTNLSYGMIAFEDSDFPSDSYMPVSDNWTVGTNGGHYELPQQFGQQFIVGLTGFRMTAGSCSFSYKATFQSYSVVSGEDVHNDFTDSNEKGIRIHQNSSTSGNACGMQKTIQSVFYIKKWNCANSTQNFNIISNKCEKNCSVGTFLQYQSNSRWCDACMSTCKACINHNVCTECEAGDYRMLSTSTAGSTSGTNGGGSCDCQPGYYDRFRKEFDYETQCGICSDRIPSCQDCIIETVTSATDFTLQCRKCADGKYLNDTASFSNYACSPCGDTCQTCQSSTICVTCHSSQFRELSASGACECKTGYEYDPTSQTGFICTAATTVRPNNGVCPIGWVLNAARDICRAGLCGDGIKVSTESCDDNNTEDNDGCSSQCEVQDDFTCSAVDSQRSICSFSATITVSNTTFKKRPFENTVELECTLTPVPTFLADLPWREGLFVSGVQALVTTASFSKNQTLLIQIQYFEDLNSKSLILRYNSKAIDSNRRLLSAVDIEFYFESQPIAISESKLLDLSYHKKGTYQMAEASDKFTVYLSYVILFLMVFSLTLKNFMPSALMIMTLQSAFISFSSLKTIDPILETLFQMRNMLGFSLKITDSTSLSNRNLQAMGFSQRFIDNSNAMLILEVVGILLMAASKIAAKLSESTKVENFFKICARGTINLSFLNLLNICFSLSLIFKTSEIQMVDIAVAGVFIFICIALSVYFLNSYAVFKQSFKVLKLSQPTLNSTNQWLSEVTDTQRRGEPNDLYMPDTTSVALSDSSQENLNRKKAEVQRKQKQQNKVKTPKLKLFVFVALKAISAVAIGFFVEDDFLALAVCLVIEVVILIALLCVEFFKVAFYKFFTIYTQILLVVSILIEAPLQQVPPMLQQTEAIGVVLITIMTGLSILLMLNVLLTFYDDWFHEEKTYASYKRKLPKEDYEENSRVSRMNRSLVDGSQASEDKQEKLQKALEKAESLLKKLRRNTGDAQNHPGVMNTVNAANTQRSNLENTDRHFQ